MPANIMQTDGQAFAAYARQGAWHMLGQVMPDDQMTPEQALELAHLSGWNVEKYPLFTTADGLVPIPVPGRYGTVMTDPISKEKRVLGDVGGRYTVFQNEEHVDFLSVLLDEAGAHIETAGALGNGEKVFVSLRLPDSIKVGGTDNVDIFIGALNAHDASMPFTVVTTPIRWECQNMINFSLRRASNRFTVRHSGVGLQGQAAEARRVLDLVYKYNEAFEEEAQRLIETSMNLDQFNSIVNENFGPKEDSGAAAQTRAEERVGTMMTLFEEANTNEGIRNTAWAGFNAITEYQGWYSETRSDDPARQRATKSLNGEWATQAYNIINEFSLA
jgi:phage/plasmid-like protein (TIGR03299 family)